MTIHADQTLCKDLKYLKFCCSDVFSGWNVPKMVVNYCLPRTSGKSDIQT